MLKHITAVALLGLTLAAPASAQTLRKPEHPLKPKVMQQRIRAGVRAGQISQDELTGLRQHLKAFRSQVQSMRSDGSVTPEERRALKQEWRKISRQVFRAKHRR